MIGSAVDFKQGEAQIMVAKDWNFNLTALSEQHLYDGYEISLKAAGGPSPADQAAKEAPAPSVPTPVQVQIATVDDDALLTALTALYRHVAPEKGAADVKKVLAVYKGNENRLVDGLAKKYSADPSAAQLLQAVRSSVSVAIAPASEL